MKITPRRITIALGIIVYIIWTLWAIRNLQYLSDADPENIEKIILTIAWLAVTIGGIFGGILTFIDYMNKTNSGIKNYNESIT